MNREMNVAEFFAGIGLMRLGLENAGWQVEFANDIAADKEEMYRGHFGDSSGHFYLSDIHDLTAKDVPTVSLATASFPCNDLSLAGGRMGLAGKNSSAFWGFVNLLRGMKSRRPAMVLVENVPGFLSSNGGRDFEEVLLSLNDLGYAVDAFFLDAACFVPQSRQRLFVVGVKSKISEPDFLEDGFFEDTVRPAALSDFIFTHPDIRWHLKALPDPPQRKNRLDDFIEDIPSNASLWWNKERSSYLLSQMSLRHKKIADKMIAGKKKTFGTVFRRVRNGKSMAELRTDGVAGCLRTPRGGSGRQILFVAGNGSYRVRLLSPRECARLMGADDFKMDVPLNQALFGFGDAVCVPVIEWIANNYLRPVWEKRFKPLPSRKTKIKPTRYTKAAGA
jgi:DNA (cytosine-5)-methyltransferase 1